MTLRLYHNWRSSSSWRVRWAFALKRVECELMHVRMLSDEAEPAGHFARNPTGFVPVVEFVEPSARFRFLAESMAIIEWAEDLFPSPPLLPAEPAERARTRQLAEIINAGTQPLQNLAVTLFHSPEAAEQRRWNRHWIERGLRAYEELVRETAGVFSMGAGLTLADLYLVPQCLNAERQEIPVEQFATVSRIYRAALATAECQATHPERFRPPGA